ncbi:hypothetical protein Hanom_Chr02g00127531 [Helianthus anomalus]
MFLTEKTSAEITSVLRIVLCRNCHRSGAGFDTFYCCREVESHRKKVRNTKIYYGSSFFIKLLVTCSIIFSSKNSRTSN